MKCSLCSWEANDEFDWFMNLRNENYGDDLCLYCNEYAAEQAKIDIWGDILDDIDRATFGCDW